MRGSKLKTNVQLKIRVPMQVSSTVYQSKIPTEIELNRNEKKQIQLKRIKLKHRVAKDKYDKIIFHVANTITCNCTTNTSTMYSLLQPANYAFNVLCTLNACTNNCIRYNREVLILNMLKSYCIIHMY